MSDDDSAGDKPMTFPPAIAGDLARVLAGLDEPASPASDPASLAALVEGGLTADEADRLLARAEDRARAEAAADFLDDVAARSGQPPASLMQAARDLVGPAPVRPSADVVQLRAPPPAAPPAPANDVEVFQLLAAATRSDDASIVCRSQSGIWTLEVFSGQSPDDREAGRGVLLLSVHPEHQASYDRRTARVFVIDAGAERVLAEGPIEAGELYADIVLAGLDLRRRDAINVVFGPAPARR
jgi:hypothetical protein